MFVFIKLEAYDLIFNSIKYLNLNFAFIKKCSHITTFYDLVQILSECNGFNSYDGSLATSVSHSDNGRQPILFHLR